MTDTIAADPGHGTDSQDGPVGGTIEHLDPHSLEVGENVREYANLNNPFLDSIAEHGVLTPITAIRRHDGVVELRNGQRRTMAARKLGLSSVPVYVLPATAADTAAETIDRIVHQIVTNDHKSDLTDAQRARGIQQMIDAGLSVSKVAKINRPSVVRHADDDVEIAVSRLGRTREEEAFYVLSGRLAVWVDGTEQ